MTGCEGERRLHLGHQPVELLLGHCLADFTQEVLQASDTELCGIAQLLDFRRFERPIDLAQNSNRRFVVLCVEMASREPDGLVALGRQFLLPLYKLCAKFLDVGPVGA